MAKKLTEILEVVFNCFSVVLCLSSHSFVLGGTSDEITPLVPTTDHGVERPPAHRHEGQVAASSCPCDPADRIGNQPSRPTT